MPSDTAVFMEFSWNPGILSRTMRGFEPLPSTAALPRIRESACLVRFSSIRHTSARSASRIKVISVVTSTARISLHHVHSNLKACDCQLTNWRVGGLIPYFKMDKAVRFRVVDVAAAIERMRVG